VAAEIVRLAAEGDVTLRGLVAGERSLEGVFDRLVHLHRGVGR
jgi:hypothetical protein